MQSVALQRLVLPFMYLLHPLLFLCNPLKPPYHPLTPRHCHLMPLRYLLKGKTRQCDCVVSVFQPHYFIIAKTYQPYDIREHDSNVIIFNTVKIYIRASRQLSRLTWTSSTALRLALDVALVVALVCFALNASPSTFNAFRCLLMHLCCPITLRRRLLPHIPYF